MNTMNRCAAPCVLLVAVGLATGAVAEPRPTYSKDVAPILNANCVSCHRPGEIAPMSLLSYDEVRPWAKSIAKNVQERAMPPWDADPGYGPFKNERTLTDDQIDTIVRWVNAGAPQGSRKDLPPTPHFDQSGWKLGEPDYVVEFEQVEIPGDGPDQFYNLVGQTDFDEDKWVKAVEIVPGDRRVVHHVILWQGGQTSQEGWIGAWAAGAQPMAFPEGTGRLLKKGQPIIGDMHYHPYGETTTDRTKVGLHFAKAEDVKKELINLWVANNEFEIPAGDPNYEAQATYTFPQDSRIVNLLPHMHYRGKDFSYTLTYPDGSTQDLLKVSKYDFNWQTVYEFEEPIEVPAGSRIDCVAHWDNSADNAANPDPTKDVRFGLESYDEMMIGFVDYVVEDGLRPEKTPNPVIAKIAELAAAHPGEVFEVMIQQGGPAPELSALHLPKEGDGGWYVRLGSAVGKAPITDIVWSGNAFTAVARIPGQEPSDLSGTVEGRALKMQMGMPQGISVQVSGTRAE